jgi:hypothetical protein
MTDATETTGVFAGLALQPGCTPGMQAAAFATLARARAYPPAAKSSASAWPRGNGREDRFPGARLRAAHTSSCQRTAPPGSHRNGLLARLLHGSQTAAQMGRSHFIHGHKQGVLDQLSVASLGLG